jgi:hypothetical protein
VLLDIAKEHRIHGFISFSKTYILVRVA